MNRCVGTSTTDVDLVDVDMDGDLDLFKAEGTDSLAGRPGGSSGTKTVARFPVTEDFDSRGEPQTSGVRYSKSSAKMISESTRSP